MKIFYIVATGLFVLLTFNYFVNVEVIGNQQNKFDSEPAQSEVLEFIEYRNDDVGILLSYRISPDGYMPIEPDMHESSSNDFVAGIVLVRITDYLDIQNSPFRGGIPTINISIFTSSTTELHEWMSIKNEYVVDQGTKSLIQVDDTSAVLYNWEGLYTGETVLFEHNGYIVLLEGMSGQDVDDPYRIDFRNMLNTIELF